MREILSFLNRKTCINVPLDPRTLKNTNVSISTIVMGSGRFQYYGLKDQIEKVLLNFADDEIPSQLQLSICTDGTYNFSRTNNFCETCFLTQRLYNYSYFLQFLIDNFY